MLSYQHLKKILKASDVCKNLSDEELHAFGGYVFRSLVGPSLDVDEVNPVTLLAACDVLEAAILEDGSEIILHAAKAVKVISAQNNTRATISGTDVTASGLSTRNNLASAIVRLAKKLVK